MKITLAVLFLAGLTIYCKCAAVLSLPPSLIAHGAASLTDGQINQKSSAFKDNGIPTEPQQQLANEESLQDATATATTNLNRNFKNLWHKNLSFFGQKRERNTFDDDIANVDDVVYAIKQNGPGQHDNNNVDGGYKNNNNNNNNNKNENENENIFLKASANADVLLKDDSDAIDLMDNTMTSSSWSGKSFHKREALVAPSSSESEILNRYLKSLKHGANRCALENQDNCLQQYYGDLIADRNKALLKQQQQQQQQKENLLATSQLLNNINNDDIVLLLTGEQNLIKFLSWALSELYPFGKLTNVTASDDSADFYHPGMYMWKKLNLSGRLQPPLLIEEPHYVIVRKDLTADDEDNEDNDYEYKRGLNYGRDPFIPPRGRKHNLPDLDSLLHRYETFVPNRGRRDKIKDIFKYDDLFYPNRGKRQMIVTPETAGAATQSIIDDNGDTDESQVNNYNADDDDGDDDIKYHNNEENANQQMYQQQLTDPAMSSNELLEYIENLMAKMKRKLPQNQQLQLQLQLQAQKQKQNNEKIANSFDEMMSNSKEPTTTGMSSTSASWPKSPSLLLNKRFKSTMFNILHNRQQQQQNRQHLPKHYRSTRQWWKRYATTATAAAAARNNHESPLSMIRSPTKATNRLQTLRSMSPQQHQLLKQLYEQQQQQQQHGVDLSPPHMNVVNTKFMWQQQQRQPKSLAQQFDPLSWHKLQMLQQQQQQQQHQHDYQPSLTIRHPRLTALQHLPVIQQQQHVATPQETQLTFASDQLDNSKTNDLDYMDNKMDLD